jgi:hypothetical protein
MLGKVISALARLGGHRGRRIVLAGVVPVVLAAAASFPTAASAYSRGFKVYNLSSHSIEFLGVTGADFDSTPPVGSILQPGVGYQDLEETYKFGQTTTGSAKYAVLDNSGHPTGTKFFATMQIYSVSTTYAGSVVTGTEGIPAVPLEASTNGTDTNTLLDPSGTVHNIPAGQGQAQAAVLNQYCIDGNSATCDFKTTSETQFEGAEHFITSYANHDPKITNDLTYTEGDTVGSSNSVEVSAMAGTKLFKVVDASITFTYNHTWTTSHMFGSALTVHCPPDSLCSIFGIAPMVRDTGDFTLTIGNTTWNLNGVYFDSPQPHQVESFSSTTQPLSSKQRSTLPSGLTRVRRATAPYRTPRGAQIVRSSLDLSIFAPRIVAVDQSARYRIILSRAQPNDQLVYTPKNITVLSTLTGRRVGHWRLGTLPRGKSRTLSLRLRVPRSTRGNFCLTVTAAANHARSARKHVCAALAASGPLTGGLG